MALTAVSQSPDLSPTVAAGLGRCPNPFWYFNHRSLGSLPLAPSRDIYCSVTFKLLVLATCAVMSSIAQTTLNPAKLRSEAFENPLGMARSRPPFSAQVESL